MSSLSLVDLAQIGNHIFSAFDHLENKCSIDEKKLFAAPQIYRSFVDEKYSGLLDIYSKMSLKEKEAFWNLQCHETCSCHVYVGFAEYLQSQQFPLSEAVDCGRLVGVEPA